MLEFDEKAICRKTAGILELAASKGYEPIAFMRLWLNSQTAANLYNMDFHDISQSKLYLLHSVELEYDLHEEDLRIGEDKILDMALPDVMYWGGYTLMYLSFLEHIEPSDILKMYDVERILKCYDTLHTLSTNTAIDIIKEDFIYRH